MGVLVGQDADNAAEPTLKSTNAELETIADQLEQRVIDSKNTAEQLGAMPCEPPSLDNAVSGQDTDTPGELARLRRVTRRIKTADAKLCDIIVALQRFTG